MSSLTDIRKAAEQGDAEAQFNLGCMYDDGEDVPEDDTEAVKWYRKAAEQGHAGAQNNLGYMYEKGEGVSQEYTEAVKSGIAKRLSKVTQRHSAILVRCTKTVKAFNRTMLKP